MQLKIDPLENIESAEALVTPVSLIIYLPILPFPKGNGRRSAQINATPEYALS